jgi:hypothetical protein
MPAPIATSAVVKLAFALMELDPVSSFADDSDQAADAATFYPIALNGTLSGTDWTFASRIASLPQAEILGIADPYLPFTYQLPLDVLKLRRVADGTAKFRVDAARLLRADMPAPLFIRYTAAITDEGAVPEAVQTVIAHRLALLMAPRWVGSQTKRDQLSRDMQMALTEARREDGDQASTERYDEWPGDWVQGAMR